MKKIYIAGPDVFELDSIEIGKRYKRLCTEYGFKGLYPLDNEADFSQKPNDIAKEIFKANKQMIKECDIVVANLNPFRGTESDSGTVLQNSLKKWTIIKCPKILGLSFLQLSIFYQ